MGLTRSSIRTLEALVPSVAFVLRASSARLLHCRLNDNDEVSDVTFRSRV
jgi:hypothetical protein